MDAIRPMSTLDALRSGASARESSRMRSSAARGRVLAVTERVIEGEVIGRNSEWMRWQQTQPRAERQLPASAAVAIAAYVSNAGLGSGRSSSRIDLYV